MFGLDLDMSDPTPVMYFNVNGEMRTLWDVKQKNLFQYGLGVAKGPGSSFVTAHTHSNTVIHWDDFQMKNVIKVKGPIAVTCPGDKSQVVALCPYKLKIFSLETSQLVRTVKYPENIVAFSSY